MKKIGVFLFLILLSGLILFYFENKKSTLSWGLTFSQKESMRLLNEWQEPYRAILDELKPDKIRLIGYWDLIEKEQNKFEFSDLDLMMRMAQERKIPVILAIGQKNPRWPECHVPTWVENDPQKEEYLLKYLQTLVNRYKSSENLIYWQVENEPFLGKEKCSPSSEEFFEQEVDFIRKIDPEHPIILADSGELSDWQKTAKFADVFGFTLYHKVYDERWGTFKVERSKKYFTQKSKTIRTERKNLNIICIEASMEPWGKVTNERLGDEQYELFTLEDMKYNLNFAKNMAPQVDDFYLWGAEWWYFAKKNNHPEYWQTIKNLIFENRSS